MKFPSEHFDELYNVKVRTLIDIHVREYGLDSGQPNLFSRGTWRSIYGGASTNSALTIASVVTAWGFTKKTYKCTPELLDQIVGAELGELEQRLDLLFKIESCAYFEGGGLWWSDLDVQGYWSSVQNNGDGSGSMLWVLNSTRGLILVEIPFDERGLEAALLDYSDTAEEFIKGFLGSQYTEEVFEWSCRFWLGGIMSEIKLMYYLLSSNAEVSGKERGTGYLLGKGGDLVVPDKLKQLNLGESIAEKIKDDGVLKNAHWELQSDGGLKWLCGADSHRFDYRNAHYCEEIDTDEDLVAMNQGCSEDEFSVILTEEESRMYEDGEITHEELRAMIAERVHQARSNVAAKNGEMYDRAMYQKSHD